MVVRQLTDSMEFSFSQRPRDVDVAVGSTRRSSYDSTPEQSASSNGRDQTKYKARAESTADIRELDKLPFQFAWL